MSLREDLLPTFEFARTLMDDLGFRESSVTVDTRVWPGPRPGQGTPVDTQLLLAPNPKVVAMSVREVASSGGLYTMGDLRIGPITPYNATNPTGYTDAQLAPGVTGGLTEVVYKLGGPWVGEYVRVALEAPKATRRMIVVRRKTTVPMTR